VRPFLEGQMLDYSIMQPEGILLLKPRATLSKEDFGGLGAVVNACLSGYADAY
jgi:hypothetical protein